MTGAGVIVLAAGRGSRMRSALPKVMHCLGGQPLLAHVLGTAFSAFSGTDPDTLPAVNVVTGYRREALQDLLAMYPGVRETVQDVPLGTAHAVEQALHNDFPGPAVSTVVILYGDVPLVRARTLQELAALCNGEQPALLTTVQEDPSGYGRIIRDDSGAIVAVTEEKDATAQVRQIREVNTGIMALPVTFLLEVLPEIDSANAAGERYLTDVIALAVQRGMSVQGLCVADPVEVSGVNDRLQLAQLERHLQRMRADSLMQAGATLTDPQRVEVRGMLKTGRDVFIDINCVFEGQVSLGDNVTVGTGCIIRDTVIEANVSIEPYSVIDGSHISTNCSAGPFSRLRPGTTLESGSRTGNFVEVKNSVVGAGSKINHLSYLGDATVGCDVNIGAGVITCNYDGAVKHRTHIGDRAFIGSNVALVAPVRAGEDSTAGAGSVITEDIAPGKLAVARARQQHVDGWSRPQKQSNKKKPKQ